MYLNILKTILINLIIVSCTLIFLSCEDNNCNTIDITSEIYEDIFHDIVDGLSKQDQRHLVFPGPNKVKEYLEKEIPLNKENQDKRKPIIVVNDSIDPTVVLSKNEKDVFCNCKTKTVFDFNKLPYNKNSEFFLLQ